MKATHTGRKRSLTVLAFTLIELLVVIAIIAIQLRWPSCLGAKAFRNRQFRFAELNATDYGTLYVGIGDLNDESKLDVAVASIPNNLQIGLGTLDVFLGNGDATFQDVIITENVAARRGTLGDFNGDGNLEFAGDRSNPSEVHVWRGNGVAISQNPRTLPELSSCLDAQGG